MEVLKLVQLGKDNGSMFAFLQNMKLVQQVFLHNALSKHNNL